MENFWTGPILPRLMASWRVDMAKMMGKLENWARRLEDREL
jgi:hypothetical protein